MVTENKILLSAKELKEITGLSMPMVYDLLHDDTMPVVKMGGRLFMHRAKFEEIMAERATPLSEKEQPESEEKSGIQPD